jgi:hypothetical protein
MYSTGLICEVANAEMESNGLEVTRKIEVMYHIPLG